MSQQGIEVIDTTVQKTHEWINTLAEVSRLEKNDAYKALRAFLHTLRDRLPLDVSAHFAAQLPMLLRGLYFEGWRPANAPFKMHAEEFFVAMSEKIISDRFIDPRRVSEDIFAVIANFTSPGELEKVRQCLPADLREILVVAEGVGA